MGSWFDENPGRLQRELDALEAAGLVYTVDEVAKGQGLLRVEVDRPHGDEVVRLTASYPDVFPYFKPEVRGPALGFDHHYHPGSGEYCLLVSGRGEWEPDDTLAWLLTEQWDKLVAANTPGDDATQPGPGGPGAQLRELEEPQAEPWSHYLATSATDFVVVDTALEAPVDGEPVGLAEVRLYRHQRLRAHVVWLADGTGTVPLSGPVAVPTQRQDAAPATVTVRWVRLSAAPAGVDADSWWRAAVEVDPGLETGGWHAEPPGAGSGSVKDRMQLVLVAFPEEVGHRETGQGWVVLVRRRRTPRAPASRAQVVRVVRAGRGDLFRREPRLASMAEAGILVVGLGGLGGHVATLLGSTCPDRLVLWDGDVLDPATAVRAPLAFDKAGLPKAEVAVEGVHATQPYTQLRPVFHQLGIPRQDPTAVPDVATELRKVLADVDLVIDATADYSVQHLLSDYAREAGTAYLRAEGLPGVWSGLIALQRPGADVCWMCWQHHLTDGTLPKLPQDLDEFIQPPGCATPTYTGAGFDLATIAAQTVRMAASYLTGDGGYGTLPADVLTVRLRDDDGRPIPPQWETHPLSRHPDCENHR